MLNHHAQRSFKKVLSKCQNEGRILRVLEVHSGLTALIAEKAKGSNGTTYDAMWSSSLTSSTILGKPDIEIVDTSDRLSIVRNCLEVTNRLPFIYDGDTGGSCPEHFSWMVWSLERNGVGAVIIEDKCGLKQNSLYGTDRKQSLEPIDSFCVKLRAGVDRKGQNSETMIFARVEALIAGCEMSEALDRARAYVTDGGADGIMIHSRHKDGAEIKEFLSKFRDLGMTCPVVVVPTSYNRITEQELFEWGANVTIHANQLIRAAFPAMMKVANGILSSGRSLEMDSELLSIKEVLELIDEV